MDRVSYRNYCDKGGGKQENLFFAFGSRGRAAAFGVAYPEMGSICQTACEKVLKIGIGSFLQRPSLGDQAVSTITDFINEGIYILQEPRKEVFCSFAILYVLRDKARFIVSENAGIYHLQDGKMQEISRGYKTPLPGKKMRSGHKLAPAFDVSGGGNGFLLCSGMEDEGFQTKLENKVLPASANADAWAESVIEECYGEHGSALAFVLPEKKSPLLRIFGQRAKQGGMEHG